jgi:hypothetical protein
MRTFTFAAGLAAGYVLGARAGREKYEQIVTSFQKLNGSLAAQTDEAGIGSAEETRTPAVEVSGQPSPASLASRSRPSRRKSAAVPTAPKNSGTTVI